MISTLTGWRREHGRYVAPMGAADSYYELERTEDGGWEISLVNDDPRLKIDIEVGYASTLDQAKQVAQWHLDDALTGWLPEQAAA